MPGSDPAEPGAQPGTLFVVATPIGNLGDLSPRAVEVLAAARFVVCEDTRHTRGLLTRHGIDAELLSLPAFDEPNRVAGILERLLQGHDGAVVSDAGTPGISDPGEQLVARAVAAGVRVVPIPGPSAVIAALSASGLPTGRFHFLGFLPRERGASVEMLEEVASLRASLVLYEAPGRVARTLALAAEVLGPRPACVARELTKLHEEFDRGTLPELASRWAAREVLGELVIIIGGRQAAGRWTEAQVQEALLRELGAGGHLKELSQQIGRVAGWPAKDVYRLGLLAPRPKPEP